LNIDFLKNGLRAKCNTGTCSRVYFQPVKSLNLKDEIEDDAFMIASDAFRSEMLRIFGPTKSEEMVRRNQKKNNKIPRIIREQK
jgi:hypothetical protein